MAADVQHLPSRHLISGVGSCLSFGYKPLIPACGRKRARTRNYRTEATQARRARVAEDALYILPRIDTVQFSICP
jgi:hypothetical protein